MGWFSKILDNILGWYAKILTITYRGSGCLEKAKNIHMYKDPSSIYSTGIKMVLYLVLISYQRKSYLNLSLCKSDELRKSVS